MKFFSELLRGELILIRPIVRAPRPPAIPARRARPGPGGDPFLVRIILWLLATLGRPALATARRTWPPITPAAWRLRWAVLLFLAAILTQVILESLAIGYIERSIGIG